jgi:LCP family protein required for cell wall assembly
VSSWRTIAGTAGYAVTCLLAAIVLVVAGYAHYVQRQVGGLASSNVDTGGPQTGAMNILLMGLESRTDYNGNILPAKLLAALHAGSRRGVEFEGVGGQDTNTLILIHIFAGGQQAVGFSIPRDDLVTFPHPYDGESEGKIDQAYGLAWAQSLNETVNSKMSHDQRYFLANEAGQQAAIDTVSAVTGEHIDHFAEVNLAGFYALAQSFGGIEVCVKSWDGGRNLHDTNSGFSQPHAGYLHLGAAQALSFVRERDNLPNGDLDRTHRQQAVIDYVLWQLGHQGALTDLGQLTNLLGVARKYLIASGKWNLLEFANEMHALTGKNLTLSTLPIATTQNNVMVNGVPQDVDILNLPYARHLVQSAFSQPPAGQAKGPAAKKKPASSIPPPSTVTVDVYNGGATDLLAAAVSQALVSAGYQAGATGSPAAQSQTVQASTQVFYGTGAAANAAKIAGYFGATATAASAVPAGHVEILLGTTSTSVPASIGPSSSGSGSPAATPTATSAANNGQAGGAVTVKSNAKFGIPCVY